MRPAHPGRTLHAPYEALPRHPHAHAFAALVLSGGYVEAGDTGRHRVKAGDMVLHQTWESHLDRFDGRGSEVLILPINERDVTLSVGRIADPDAIVRAAEVDRAEAARQMLQALCPIPAADTDWPDLLAHALRESPNLNLTTWSDRLGVHRGSISRGFRQVFGVTPMAFRLVQRTRRAILAIQASATPLIGVAQDCGFADQAHMTRAVRTLTGLTPAKLRNAAFESSFCHRVRV